MQNFVGTSLKTRLYLMVLLAFLPVSFLIFFITEEQKAYETEAILKKIMVLAGSAATEENLQLESTRNLLVALSDTFLKLKNDPTQLSVLMTKILKQSKGYEAFGITAPDGRLIAGGNPEKLKRNYSRASWFLSLSKDRKMTIGQYRKDHIEGEPVLYIAFPAFNEEDEIEAVVFAAVNLNWMNRTIFKQLVELPHGSRLILLDETQGILEFDVDAGKWSIPVNFDPELRDRIFNRKSGTLTSLDGNNVKKIYAFAPLNSPLRAHRLSLLLEIPQASAFSATKQIFFRNLVLLILSALMAVFFIWWVANSFILRRVGKIVDVSRQLTAGNIDARIGDIGGRDELGHLAGVFDEMAAALQLRIESEEQAMASLEKSREQFRNLAAYHQEVREQQRIRIAREIHDQLGQSLTILKMDLAWIKKHVADDPNRVNEKMAVMADIIDDALKELHAVTAELRPVVLDDFGLVAAMEWQIEEFGKHSRITCRLDNNGFEPDLPKEQATALFRIFQETLTNIIRHAEADEVIVLLEQRNGKLILRICDNGRGITAAEINDPKSYGLLGMRERLFPFNGRVSFEGKPGQGTCVSVILPMPQERI